MTKDELIEFYNRISVFANSSMHEGLGMTALEAQACGAPVVFFRDARIPEEVTVNFIPSIDEKDFAENMLRLIKDEEFRNSHLKSVEERSLEKEYPKALLNMYSDLLED
jgi:glycosyltransferase involved in cell wall biosynthesis